MPIYDYRCTDCGREIEVVHGIHGSGPETCETCGGAMRKALSTPAIHFKGSGWAKKDAAKPAGSAAPASGSGEAKSGRSSDKDDKTSSSSDQKDSGGPSGEASSSPADSSTAGKAATGSQAD